MTTTTTAAGTAAGTAAITAGSASSSSSAGSANSSTALSSLSGNLTDFLKLLMTQLQNQDPTSPMDTNQFTGQLVQYASVEQQINANSNLTKLIELTQGNQVLQSSAMVGKQVSVDSDHLSLQNGSAALTIKPAQSGTVAVAIYDDAGKLLRQDSVDATSAGTQWRWDGRDSNGAQVPDGSYRVAAMGSTNGTTSAVPFSVLGTATGVQRADTGTKLQIGALTVDFSKVQQVSAGS